MSNCSTCSKGFGFFNRELGCVKCNRVFCKKCLCYDSLDDKNKKVKVCLRCFKIGDDSFSNRKEKSFKIEELLEVKPNEFTVPILLPATTSSAVNVDIRNRLDLLKDNNDNKDSSNETDNIDDIKQRLANLKGVEYKASTNKILFATDTRSQQEQIDDLLKQFVEEKEINCQYETEGNDSAKTGTIDDIERRLAILRGQDPDKIKSPMDQEFKDETEQEEIDRTVLNYIEEAQLPEFSVDPAEQEFIDSIPLPPSGNKKDIEELPFCEICNEDAVIRCSDCVNLFCHKCFLEFHDEEDYKTHKTKPYEAPKNNNDE